MKIKSIALTLFAALSIAFSANAQKTIVDVAVGSSDHTTLVAAVKAADLVGVLQGAGPFTVFAPTNAAFAKLPAGTVETLLKPDVILTDEKGGVSTVVATDLGAS